MMAGMLSVWAYLAPEGSGKLTQVTTALPGLASRAFPISG